MDGERGTDGDVEGRWEQEEEETELNGKKGDRLKHT